MAKKKFNFQKFTTKACELQRKMEDSIISEMDRLNIGLISFVKNGDYAEFDVDRAFALVDTWDEPQYCEVIGVMKYENRVCIIANTADLKEKTLNLLEQAELFPQEEIVNIVAEIGDEDEIRLVEETLMPTDTLLEICDSMQGIQQLVEKPITERVNISR